jgi:hypothetical protein
MKTRTVPFKSLVITLGLSLFGMFAFAQKQPAIQYFRPYDQRGINVFETSKVDTTVFDGLKVRFGAGFTQGYQNMEHSNNARAILVPTTGATLIETGPGSGSFVNRATGAPVSNIVRDPKVYGGYINSTNNTTYTNSNQLFQLAGGFPLAQANFNMDVQLADGVRLNLVSYMSSHHHNEFWVKGGFFQIDKVGFMNSEFMNNLWKNLTLKVGHMEVNYGDAHFRRSDGGHTLWNPWIENNIMDAFNTEIGAELYWQKNGVLAMAGITDGEIQGNVGRPNDRSPSIYGKLGYDKQLQENLRVRLTGSAYYTKSSVSNTLFGGDRTGSNYQFVMDNTGATVTTAYTSGRFNPGYRDNVTTFMVNPFVKYSGLEFFGTWEYGKGKSAIENGEGTDFESLDNRQTHQSAGEVLYRFGKNEKFYLGARYQKLTSTISIGQSATNQGTRYPVSIDRTSIGAGWFITKNVLFKGEYVNQNYKDYPTDNILSEGNFKGVVIQGVIAF